jgi:hypothetical protein
MRSALAVLAAGGVSLVALFSGGFGPCGPSGIVGLVGLLGTLIFFPLAALILLACGVRALLRGARRTPEDLA